MNESENVPSRLNQTIIDIQQNLEAGRFTSEAAVSQGIVLPVLQALGWPVFDMQRVTPQYELGARRVDYALRDQYGHPRTFIEVKRVGQGDVGERQLFEYAYHQGIQLAVLTDGQEWSFYLPGEEGNYEERRVYKLDLLERESKESTDRLQRYLSHERVLGGEALLAARDDYRNIARTRSIESTLPKAWDALLSSQDSLLVELLADKVEDLCGYKPNLEICSQFISGISKQPIHGTTPPMTRTSSLIPSKTSKTTRNGEIPQGKYGYSFGGKSHSAGSAREVMKDVLTLLAGRDATFLERFVTRKHGRKRRYVSRDPLELYPDRPDLSANHSLEFVTGWWLGTNYSRKNIEDIIRLACEVAGVGFGKDLQINLG